MPHTTHSRSAKPPAASVIWLIAAATHAAAGTVYIAPSAGWQTSSWRYAAGKAAPTDAWNRPEFDDAGWSEGKAPFGYGVGGYVKYGTRLTDMQGAYTTLCLRKRFYVDDAARTAALKLSVNYDDGFIAWINGAEAARRNAPAEPTFQSTATASHEASAIQRYEVIAVSNAGVRPGWNVLAVQVFNHRIDDAAAHFDASLIDTHNLALNRLAVVSSVARDARFFQPYAALDGSQLTFWSSQPDTIGASEWITVDLGRSFTVDKAAFYWWGGAIPGFGAAPRRYRLQISHDGESWIDAAAPTDQDGGEDRLTFAPVAGRYVRASLDEPTRNRSYGLLEMEVYQQGVAFDAREFQSLSLNRPARASTEHRRETAAGKAVDNIACSWWWSAKDAPDPQWLEVDLEAPRRVSGVKTLFTDAWARRFAVEVSPDGIDWRQPPTAVDTEVVPAGDNHRIHRIMFARPVDARHVRILLWDPNPQAGQFGITEFMVIGPPDAGP